MSPDMANSGLMSVKFPSGTLLTFTHILFLAVILEGTPRPVAIRARASSAGATKMLFVIVQLLSLLASYAPKKAPFLSPATAAKTVLL